MLLRRSELLSNKEIVALIPNMTSNTSPYGICSAGRGSNVYGGDSVSNIYQSFDGNIDTYWWTGIGSPSKKSDACYIQYEFFKTCYINKVYFVQSSWTKVPRTVNHIFLLQHSLDGNTWTTIDNNTYTTDYNYPGAMEFDKSFKLFKCKYIRLTCSDVYDSSGVDKGWRGGALYISILQCYGWYK